MAFHSPLATSCHGFACSLLWHGIGACELPQCSRLGPRCQLEKVEGLTSALYLQIEAMWEQTQGAAAEQQKVLWSVELEGERALHYFETLPPEAAFAQLLRLGLSSALHLLACSEGATLPPAESALQRYTPFLAP